MEASQIIARVGSRPTVESSWANSIPTIDGAIAAAEWQDATFVDISSDGMEAFAYLKNDSSFLYVAVDAPFAGEYGWQEGVPWDRIRIDFDTGNDQSLFVDRYFEFGAPTEEGAVESIPVHGICECSFSTEAGLGVASDDATGTVQYELKIPLSFIGAPGASAGMAIAVKSACAFSGCLDNLFYPANVELIPLCDPFSGSVCADPPAPDDVVETWAVLQLAGSGGGTPPVVTNPLANPDKIPNDGSSMAVLTVNVTDPDGDLASVVIDLSPLGGSAAQPMLPSAFGTSYSVQTTVLPSTCLSLKALKVTATDQAGNTGFNVVTLFVTSVIVGTGQGLFTNVHSVCMSVPGQSLDISHFLIAASPSQILQTEPDVSITVKNPHGKVYTTEIMSTTPSIIRVDKAEAGTWTYMVSNEGSNSPVSRMLSQRNPVSYQIETATGGIGIVSGTIQDDATQNHLTGVLLTTDTGGAALSIDGYYVMVTTAGVFTVTASSFGYQAGSEANVTLAAGQTVTVDFSLTAVTLNEIQLVGITTDLTAIPQPGVPVQFTANATGPNTIYYRFLYRAGYGTAAYATNQFVPAQDWSTNNTANIMFPGADNYIVVVQATEDSAGAWAFGDPQGGLNIVVP